MARFPADPRRPLTLRDVSEASGVSEMTVSRVLRNRGDVSEATRVKVLEVLDAWPRAPNKIAGALAAEGERGQGHLRIPTLSNCPPDMSSGISPNSRTITYAVPYRGRHQLPP